MLATGLCFVGVTVLVRLIGTSLPATQASFIRYFFGVLLLGPTVYRLFNGQLKVTSVSTLAARGVVHSIAVIFWFYAMARIPMAEVTALGYLTPILVTIAAAIFLGRAFACKKNRCGAGRIHRCSGDTASGV